MDMFCNAMEITSEFTQRTKIVNNSKTYLCWN